MLYPENRRYLDDILWLYEAISTSALLMKTSNFATYLQVEWIPVEMKNPATLEVFLLW